MNKKKFYIYSLTLFAVFFMVITFLGIFKIGILSDTFSDSYTAVNSTAVDKITNNLEYIDTYRYRPVLFLTLKGIVNINKFLGISFDNFILYRSVNILLYVLFAFISGFIVLKFTGNINLSILTETFILIYPNNLHNLCWSAAYFEILCGILYLMAFLFLIKFINSKSIRILTFSNVLFVLALLTKEIAITFPLFCVIFLFMIYGKTIFSKFRSIYISQILILILYFISKTFLNKGIPVISGKYFENDFWTNSVQIVFKGIIASIIPIDFSVLIIKLKDFNIFLLIYLGFVLVLSIVLLLGFFKQKKIKLLFLIGLSFLILIAPYIYAGYIRPQLILLPFTLLVILIFSFIEVKTFLIKYISIVILVFWLIWGYEVINDWKTAYSEGKGRIENVLKKDFTPNKKVLLIGNPARFQQCFMYDNIIFPYNYFKYHDFVIRDTISDVIRTVALDEKSLNSELKVIISGNKEYEISCSGETQFFYLSGDELQIKRNNGLKNDLISVEFLNYNKFDKPTKIRLKILSDNTENYIFKGRDLIRLN